jgi:hypothetical protein
MAPNTFPLSLIVDVSVQVAAVAAAPPTFNQGLIVGSSSHIPSVGANSRVRQYTSLAGMTSDGFAITDPEYLAASAYFAPTPAAQFVWIGRQDLTAVQTAVPHSGSAGTGYKVGDTVTPTQGGASGALLVVLSVTAGAVTALGTTPGNQGTGYSDATALPTTTNGTGTGLEVDITAIGESIVQAVAACRIASPNWYLVGACGAADADHLAVAAFTQTATPQAQYVGNTSTAAVAAGTTGNIAAELQAALYNRVYLQYSTTQSGAAPNNAYFFAGLMGVAMGLNTGLAGSYFTMKFKAIPTMTTEPVSQTQLTTIEGQNCNLYLDYANAYSFEEQGQVANGQFFDEVLFLDMLGSQIQYNCVALFASQNSIPQSDGGEQLLINAVNNACQTLRNIGFIAQNGTWSGITILGLSAGNALPNGFLVQAPPFSQKAQYGVTGRQMMPIYVALIEAGAGHSLTVGVTVQR